MRGSLVYLLIVKCLNNPFCLNSATVYSIGRPCGIFLAFLKTILEGFIGHRVNRSSFISCSLAFDPQYSETPGVATKRTQHNCTHPISLLNTQYSETPDKASNRTQHYCISPETLLNAQCSVQKYRPKGTRSQTPGRILRHAARRDTRHVTESYPSPPNTLYNTAEHTAL